MTSRNALQNACSLLDSAHPSTYVLRSAGVEFNRLVSSDLQILDPRGRASFLGLSSSKTEPPPQPGCVCCVLAVIHAAGSSLRSHRVLFSRCRQKNRGESTFSFPPQPPPLLSLPANTCTDSLSPSCLLTLRFIFRALWIEAAYFLRHTHTQSSHVCTRVHRYAWHARLVGNTHTHPYTLRGESTRGMAAMPKH